MNYHASVLRGTTTLPVDLEKIFHGDTTADFPLTDQDTLRVEFAQITINVAGEVLQPGIYKIGNAATLGDALRITGGVSPAADLTACKSFMLTAPLK